MENYNEVVSTTLIFFRSYSMGVQVQVYGRGILSRAVPYMGFSIHRVGHIDPPYMWRITVCVQALACGEDRGIVPHIFRSPVGV